MAKEIKQIVKMQLQAGAATPAPPVGTALGPHGVNIQEFCQQFNAKTQDRRGEVVPVEMTIFVDRSFSFILKTAPASDMIKKVLNLPKGSGKPLQEKVGSITQAQLAEIAKAKMPDLNTSDLEAAKKIIAGTARQMGVTIKD